MPAAAVIPAPIAYIKVVAVKKLVVERGSCQFYCQLPVYKALAIKLVSVCVYQMVTLTKLECSKQAQCLYILAWDNKKGISIFVG